MKKTVLVALTTLGFGFAAHAGVQCSVYVASDATQPNNMDKSLIDSSVKPSPSSNPQDPNRYTCVIVKKDNSSAFEISRAALDKMDHTPNGFNSVDGDTLLTYQESASDKGLYAVFASTIDASKKLDDMRQEAYAYGGLPLVIGVPSKKFGVLCKQAKN